MEDTDSCVDWGKKRTKKKVEAVPPVPAPANDDYTHEELLKRLYAQLANSGAVATTRIPPPVLGRAGKRICIVNFSSICSAIRRSPEHAMSYIQVELGSLCALDGSGQQLTIRGIYKQHHVENVLKHYVRQYVACQICHSLSTEMERDNRISYVRCLACSARSSVEPIKAGFQARLAKKQS